MYTLAQTINWSQSFIEYSPLTAGTNFEPAVTVATVIRNTILNAPLTWPWNRVENTSILTLTAGTQDYTVALPDFGYLEKMSLTNTAGNYTYELTDILNTGILGSSSARQQPKAVAVKSVNYGTNVTLRFMGPPDQGYTSKIVYQSASVPFQVSTVTAAAAAVGGNTVYTGTFSLLAFATGTLVSTAGFVNAGNNGTFPVVSVTATTLTLANPNGVLETHAATALNQSWYPIPDSYSDIYNNLFLAEAFQAVDDARGAQYRQRGIAALLSKAEGLTDMQRSVFLAQALVRDSQSLSTQLKVQQGTQARAV